MPLAVTASPIDRALESRATEIVASDKQFEASLSQSMAKRSAPVQRTQLSTADASSELRQAWTRATGEVPDDKTVALLTAQWAHETAHGASMYNYNFGGIKGKSPSGLFVEQHTKEGWGHNERQIVDHFRAYESAQAGADDYVKLLTHRFPEATNAARLGDAEGFVQGLKQRGYFTGDARAYQRSVTSISNDLLATAFRASGSTQPARTSSTSASGLNSTSKVHEYASPSANARAQSQGVLASMLQPLTPTALMGALSETPTSEQELLGLAERLPLGHVSTSSMVDEILRASLQLASSDRNVAEPAGERR